MKKINSILFSLCFLSPVFAQKMRYIDSSDFPALFNYENPLSLVSLLHNNSSTLPLLAKENNCDGVYHAEGLIQMGLDTAQFTRFTLWTPFKVANSETYDTIEFVRTEGSLQHFLDSIRSFPYFEEIAQMKLSLLERIWNQATVDLSLRIPFDYFFETKHIVALIIEDRQDERWMHFISTLNGKRFIGISLREEQLFKNNLVFFHHLDDLLEQDVTEKLRTQQLEIMAATQNDAIYGYNEWCHFNETAYPFYPYTFEISDRSRISIQYKSANELFFPAIKADTSDFIVHRKSQQIGNTYRYYNEGYEEYLPLIKTTNDWDQFSDSIDLQSLFYYYNIDDTLIEYQQFLKTNIGDTIYSPIQTDIFWVDAPNQDIYVLVGIRKHENLMSYVINNIYFTQSSSAGPITFMQFDNSTAEFPLQIDLDEIEKKLQNLYGELLHLKTKKQPLESLLKEAQLINKTLNF